MDEFGHARSGLGSLAMLTNISSNSISADNFTGEPGSGEIEVM